MGFQVRAIGTGGNVKGYVVVLPEALQVCRHTAPSCPTASVPQSIHGPTVVCPPRPLPIHMSIHAPTMKTSTLTSSVVQAAMRHHENVHSEGIRSQSILGQPR